MDIPDNKRFFRIGEVSRIIGVKPYVLRYWETEFPPIRPKRADSRQRIYQREDIETIGEIKRLLYEEKLTVEGARRRLKSSKKTQSVPPDNLLKQIKEELKQILKILQ
ncbi:MAG: MerR family transcriptional regulator [Deltaproteobacteria bacterium]|jgi:DNA-binding transcriptional MerR regulator|nr:MAG: MerR family transcriptional regulator [Deltaproteobacteria bacterium]